MDFTYLLTVMLFWTAKKINSIFSYWITVISLLNKKTFSVFFAKQQSVRYEGYDFLWYKNTKFFSVFEITNKCSKL